MNKVTEEQGKAIEDAGKAAQRYVIASYEHAQNAESTGSRQELMVAASEHVQESHAAVRAVKVYGDVVQNQRKKP